MAFRAPFLRQLALPWGGSPGPQRLVGRLWGAAGGRSAVTRTNPRRMSEGGSVWAAGGSRSVGADHGSSLCTPPPLPSPHPLPPTHTQLRSDSKGTQQGATQGGWVRAPGFALTGSGSPVLAWAALCHPRPSPTPACLPVS